MRPTDYTNYTLRTLIYMAVHPGELITIQRVADTFDIPKNHLIKIVQQLGQDGFLHTVRGRAGGIMLGRPAIEINLDDVVRATEPDFRMVEYFHGDDSHCVITHMCGLHDVLRAMLRTHFEVLDDYTLQDLVDRPSAVSRALGEAPLPMPRTARRKGVATQALVGAAIAQH